MQRQFWTSAEVTLRRSEIFQHLVIKPITLVAQNGRSRFQQLEELKDWITDRPFLHWLWIWYYMIISNINWWCTGPFWWRRLVQIFPFYTQQANSLELNCIKMGVFIWSTNLLHHLFWLHGFYPTEGIIKVISWRTGQAPTNNINKFYTDKIWRNRCILRHIGVNNVSGDLNILLSVQKLDQSPIPNAFAEVDWASQAPICLNYTRQVLTQDWTPLVKSHLGKHWMYTLHTLSASLKSGENQQHMY